MRLSPRPRRLILALVGVTLVAFGFTSEPARRRFAQLSLTTTDVDGRLDSTEDSNARKIRKRPSSAGTTPDVRLHSDRNIGARSIKNKKLSNEDLTHITVRNFDYLYDADWKNCIFRESVIAELAISDSTLTDVRFVDCKIFFLELRKVRGMRVRFDNCTIETLRIIDSDMEAIDFSTCSGQKIELLNNELKKLMFWTFIGKDIDIRGGRIELLDLEKAGVDGKNIHISGVELVQPVLSQKIATELDMSLAFGLNGAFYLRQDYEARSNSYGKAVNRALYRQAQGIYTAIAGQLKKTGLSIEQRLMEYRAQEMKRKSMPMDLGRVWDYIWNDQMRGHYGLSPTIVVRTMMIFALIFAAAYLMMGELMIAWGAYVPANSIGLPLQESLIRMLLREEGMPVGPYIVTCIVFSVDQMLLGSTRVFEFEQLIERFRIIPRRYMTVGLGRIVGGIESFLGIVLMFNLLTAFLRTL